jgi:hypothetical protein
LRRRRSRKRQGERYVLFYDFSQYVKRICLNLSRKTEHVIRSHHRLALCNLATSQFDWIVPTKKHYGSAIACGTQCAPSGAIVVDVAGGDRSKIGKKGSAKNFFVTVGRPGSTDAICAQLGIKHSAKPNNDEKQDWIVVGKHSRFLMREVGDISSSAVRKAFLGGSLKQLVEEGVLDESVAKYMIDNRDTLFE